MLEKSTSLNQANERDEVAERLSLAALPARDVQLQLSKKAELLSDISLAKSDRSPVRPEYQNSAIAPILEHAGTAALVLGSMLLARSAFKLSGVLSRAERGGIAAFERGGLSALGRVEAAEAAEASSLSRGFGLKHGLALDSGNRELGSLETKTISDMLKRPIPRFDSLKVGPVSEPMSSGALQQSQAYVESGLVKARLEDGVRLPVVTDSKGFTSSGLAVDASEKFIVVDKANDPVLKAVIDDATSRFAGRAANPELAMDLRNYVSTVMNRYNLSGSSLEQAYEEALRRSSQKLIPLGFFVSRGSAPCLPRSALYKTLADEIGLQSTMREGFVGITRAQPHVWNEVSFGSKFHLFDASHPPNPALRYLSTKH